MQNLRNQKKSLARVNVKINNFNLLDEKLPNSDKLKKAKRLVKCIKECRKQFFKKKSETPSLTTVPFFDIDYKTIVNVIMKNDKNVCLSAHDELKLLY